MTTAKQQDDGDANPRHMTGIRGPIREEDENDQSETTARYYNIEHGNKLAILRDLLSTERNRNEQRRANNSALQDYLSQLQIDYLRLQRELLDALDLGHKISAQKDAQLETLKSTLDEREHLISQLREKLDSLDEQRLRDEFNNLIGKQADLAELEREQLRKQTTSLEQQLVRERVSSSELLQQLQTKLENQMQSQVKVEKELAELLNEPTNMVLRSLREEKCELEHQVDELSTLLDQSSAKFDKLQKRMESLSEEQEQMDKRNEEELEKLGEVLKVAEQRALEAKMVADDKEETAQILQFNLQRCERRIKNLLCTLKGKEAAYKELISSLELKHEEDLEKLTVALKSNERKAVELSNDLDAKQNEIMRIQLGLETRIDSLRNDRDSRLEKLNQEKQKAERGMQAAEIKVAQLIEELDRKNKLITQNQKEASQFREEARRLSIELTKNEAILYGKQKELNEMMSKISSDSSRRLEEKCVELQEVGRHAKRMEQVANELRCDNEKLSTRLRMTEQKLSQLGAAISKEQSKMVLIYEKKMQQIREEQSVFDRNKLRYKKYGYKLKKYCEHLRRVHEHLCNPNLCGYTIIPTKPAHESAGSATKPNQKDLFSSDDEAQTNNDHPCEKRNENDYGRENLVSKNSSACSAPTRRKGRFSIKRTNSGASLKGRRSALSNLKSAQSLNNPLYRETMPFDSPTDHKYYSIDEATI